MNLMELINDVWECFIEIVRKLKEACKKLCRLIFGYNSNVARRVEIRPDYEIFLKNSHYHTKPWYEDKRNQIRKIKRWR